MNPPTRLRNCALGATIAAVLVVGADADTGKAKTGSNLASLARVASVLCGGQATEAARSCVGRAFDVLGEAVALARQF